MGIQGGSVLFGLLLVLAVFCHSACSATTVLTQLLTAKQPSIVHLILMRVSLPKLGYKCITSVGSLSIAISTTSQPA
uniref:CD59 molecule (CD59 blood group) n=1 Tax=Homo sapiens TaxID=9606 RepID=A0A9L9PXZ4_HUMAN